VAGGTQELFEVRNAVHLYLHLLSLVRPCPPMTHASYKLSAAANIGQRCAFVLIAVTGT
jgi:hypothetical protein